MSLCKSFPVAFKFCGNICVTETVTGLCRKAESLQQQINLDMSKLKTMRSYVNRDYINNSERICTEKYGTYGMQKYHSTSGGGSTEIFHLSKTTAILQCRNTVTT